MEINDKFKVDTVIKDNRKVVLLKGIIDEDAHLDAIKQLGTQLTFNFKNVQSINSCGVRSWVNLLKELSGAEVFYEECPPHIVRQLNMVPSFLGHARVVSAYVPYVCDSSGEEKLVLYPSDQFKSIPETIPCEDCEEGEAELDGNPKQYFAFFK